MLRKLWSCKFQKKKETFAVYKNFSMNYFIANFKLKQGMESCATNTDYTGSLSWLKWLFLRLQTSKFTSFPCSFSFVKEKNVKFWLTPRIRLQCCINTYTCQGKPFVRSREQFPLQVFVFWQVSLCNILFFCLFLRIVNRNWTNFTHIWEYKTLQGKLACVQPKHYRSVANEGKVVS